MQRTSAPSFFSFLLRSLLTALIVATPSTPMWAGTTLRTSGSTAPTSTSSTGSTGGAAVTPNAANVKKSIKRSADATNSVANMQAAMREVAKTNSVKTQLNVARTSEGAPLLWVGASPVKDSTSSLTVTQTQSQAFLQWSKFDLGSSDTLTFDQKTYGGADVNNWIAFNYVRDPSAKPSQIYGSIKADGQVYIINANGIIFGGTAQVNTHALVASSLPINPNLLQNGLLVQESKNVQFLFSGLSADLGNADASTLSGFDPNTAVDGYTPLQTPFSSDGKGGVGTYYGKIEVLEGARLTADNDAANHIGGRISLIAPYVSNKGLLQADDGQVILAAGFQVGLAAHRSDDPTLRGLDAFVGSVNYSDPDTNMLLENLGVKSGTVENWGASDSSGNLTDAGIIQANRGSIYLTGRTVNQNGILNSTTSVSYNGRIDLVAGYNAVANAGYSATASVGDFQSASYFYRSNTGDDIGASVLAGVNLGTVTLGVGSVLSILPEVWSQERVVGDLALPSQVNIEASSVHLLQNSTLVAPGAAVPTSTTTTQSNGTVSVVAHPAYGADGIAFDSGVMIRAGGWSTRATFSGDTAAATLAFVHTADAQQIYLEPNAVIDVAGLTSDDVLFLDGSLASVTENIISVELRGTELANSPLQRDGALRGQTVQVDVRQHGAWDSSLNGGLGGYTWVGTPLADTSGWVNLTTHTVAELTTDGGSVSLKAGGALVVSNTAAIDVSGGSIAYQGGYVQTTKVLSDGHIYDIATATADRIYDGVYTGVTTSAANKWSVKTSMVNSLAVLGGYEQGYKQGGNGGSLSLTAPVMALDGTLSGTTVADSRQRNLSPRYSPTNPTGLSVTGVSNWLLTALNLPTPSQLSLTVARSWLPPLGSDSTYFTTSPTPAQIVFTDTPGYDVRSTSTNPVWGSWDFAESRNFEINLNSSLFGTGGFAVLSIDNSAENFGQTSKDGEPLAFGALSSSVGTIELPKNVILRLGAGGSINLKAGNIILDTGSQMIAPGGQIALSAYDIATSYSAKLSDKTGVPAYNPERGKITVGEGAVLSTAGFLSHDLASEPLVTGGGVISLAGSSVELGADSLLDVSGSASVSASRKLTFGAAGSITLKAGQDLSFGYVLGGALNIDSQAQFQGYAGIGQAGGKLSLTAPTVRIGTGQDLGLIGSAAIATDSTTGALLVRTLAVAPDLATEPDFFSKGGFTSFSFTGLGIETGDKGVVLRDDSGSLVLPSSGAAVEIAGGVKIAPIVFNWQKLNKDGVLAVGEDSLVAADIHLRQPVSLAFAAKGLLKDFNSTYLTDADANATGVRLGEGAVLTTDSASGTGGASAFKGKLGQISLTAGVGGTLDILGQIVVPGGTITLSQDQDSDSGAKADYKPTIYLGASSKLDVSGQALWSYDSTHTFLATATERGFYRSDVSDGGKISIEGNIVAEAGSLLNVSGSTAKVWQTSGGAAAAANSLTGGSLVSTTKDSNGGTLSLTADQMLFLKAMLNGSAGGTGAIGGSLYISSSLSGHSGSQSSVVNDTPVFLLQSVSPNFKYNGLGSDVTDATSGGTFITDSTNHLGQIIFGTDLLRSSGFDALAFAVVGNGAVEVSGNTVELKANRQISLANAGALSFADDFSSLTVAAPYVKLGRDFPTPGLTDAPITPTTGGGQLIVKASSLIDVGTLSLLNAQTASLDGTVSNGISGATNGAIRGNGTLAVAGEITLKAGQIYPTTASIFTIEAADYTPSNSTQTGKGTVVIAGSGLSQNPGVPLSAGGTLAIYASEIDQGGVLRAPFGAITLGSKTDKPGYYSATTELKLGSGSLTSVSALDPSTGKGTVIPYGIDVNGDTWIAPSGADITTEGPPLQKITLSSSEISVDGQNKASGLTAATIDISGGGDMFAYRYVSGVGGTNDILGASALNSGAFAIIPSYSDAYAPYAPYQVGSTTLGGDLGYTLNSATYSIGDRICLYTDGTPHFYTILPARYALLVDGAYLVTPKSSASTVGAAAAYTTPEGASLVSGYRLSGFGSAGSDPSIFKTYEVTSQSVLKKRAQYDRTTADTFFTTEATKLGSTALRTPADAGQLVLAVQSQLALLGQIKATPDTANNGRTGMVDISTSQDIFIGKTESADVAASVASGSAFWLNSDQLDGIGSVLIGGTREKLAGISTTALRISTGSLTVEGDASIVGNSDLILASTSELNIAGGAEIISGTQTISADRLTVSGDGALVRISSDADARLDRKDSSIGSNASLTVGQNATLSGAAVILDSSGNLAINETAAIGGGASNLSLNSSLISVGNTPTTVTAGLAANANLVRRLSQSARLSLLSYNGNIDFYSGSIELGNEKPVVIGSSKLGYLTLHASSLNNVGNGDVTLSAGEVLLDRPTNVAIASPAGATAASSGELDIMATSTVRLGSGPVATQNFKTINVSAPVSVSVEGQDTGAGTTSDPVVHSSFKVVGGDLNINTPTVVAAASANGTISADGLLQITGTGTATVATGLAAKLTLSGSSVGINGTAIKLPSGSLAITATSGDLIVTNGAAVDVSGQTKTFFDVTKSTDGGSISLTSNQGKVDLSGGTVRVGQSEASKKQGSSSTWTGSAGILTISAPNGVFLLDSTTTMDGSVASSGAVGGSADFDVASIGDTSTSKLGALHGSLDQGGFNHSLAIRVRSGDVEVDGGIHTHNYSLSADGGKITVDNGVTINASAGLIGKALSELPKLVSSDDLTGGKIDLAATGSVILQGKLTAAGYCFDNAAKGGAISLSAGGYTYTDAGGAKIDDAAIVDIRSIAQIDLSVANRFTAEDLVRSSSDPWQYAENRTDLPAYGGTLHLRESQDALVKAPTQFDRLANNVVVGASSVSIEGFKVYDLSSTGGLIDSTIENTILDDGNAFATNVSSSQLIAPSAIYHFQPGAEIVNTSTDTSTQKIVTLTTVNTSTNSTASTGSSTLTVNLAKSATVELLVPGGIPVGEVLKLTSSTPSAMQLKVKFADGTSTAVALSNGTGNYTVPADAVAAHGPIKSVVLVNTSSTAAKTEVLSFTTVKEPIAFVIPRTVTVTAANAVTTTAAANDVTLANTWDLSSYRFNKEPGVLTLRARNNLVFTFDASLSDGFNTTQTVDLTSPEAALDNNNPLWMATLKSDRSWSYRLVGGADYSAANTSKVMPLSSFIADSSGSVLVGQGAPALPSTGTLTRAAIVPRYFQTIRTGTGDIDIFAGRDVKILNPLATIYTAGQAAISIDNFDTPTLVLSNDSRNQTALKYAPFYDAEYAQSGGNITIYAQNDIMRQLYESTQGLFIDDSTAEMPTNWLYRRGSIDANGNFQAVSGSANSSEIQSTSWWVDYSNFFDDVGALGGGNITLTAGNDVKNINASVATNARVTKQTALGDTLAANQTLYELGGGDIHVVAGNDINGGVYYAERGDISLQAGQDVTSNITRNISDAEPVGATSPNLLPTTLFLGKGRIDVLAGRNLWLGPIANAFLAYQGYNNRAYYTTYFSTYDPTDTVTATALGGDVTFQVLPSNDSGASLYAWFDKKLYSQSINGKLQPWLNEDLVVTITGQSIPGGGDSASKSSAALAMGLLPGTLSGTAFKGDINVVGRMTLAPADKGSIDLLTAGNFNGLSPNSVNNGKLASWQSAAINLSDASQLNKTSDPSGLAFYNNISLNSIAAVNDLFAELLLGIVQRIGESGSTKLTLAQKLLLHDPQLLHANDIDPITGHTIPMRLYATGGDLSGLTLYSAKAARVAASNDMTDVALYIQNVRSDDISLVAAGRDLIAYAPNSALRANALLKGGIDQTSNNQTPIPASNSPTAGDIQVSGPGTLEVLAGRDLTLGALSSSTVAPTDGTAVGITSVGSARNPYLPLNQGANIVADVGIRKSTTSGAAASFRPGLAAADFNFAKFISDFLDPASPTLIENRYADPLWLHFDPTNDLPLSERQALAVMQVFYRILNDTGLDYNNSNSKYYRSYELGLAAVSSLMPGSLLPGGKADGARLWQGNISMPTKLVKTFEGGSISLLAPGGQILVGRATDPQKADQGILTQYGGAISIYASGNVDVGTSRIFTLRGGDEMIWSTLGNIAAGSGSKTVYSAPPTRVLINSQSADVQNDLAGLATGSGIGVLATLASVEPGNVNLIAPSGTVDAGDAGIRSSGHVNVSAAIIVNAANIQSSAGTSGTPVAAPSNVGAVASASAASAGASSSAIEAAKQQQRAATQQQEEVLPSIISVEVIGYGGGEGEDVAHKKDEAGNG